MRSRGTELPVSAGGLRHRTCRNVTRTLTDPRSVLRKFTPGKGARANVGLALLAAAIFAAGWLCGELSQGTKTLAAISWAL